MDSDDDWPKPPLFSEEQLRRCRDSGDYIPLLFEWYKFVGHVAVIVACIQPNSPAFRQVPVHHYHVLAGLLNRCARLMLSNIALSHEGRFGETTAIVDRCIFETALKIVWLCDDRDGDRFLRYTADGLKTELEFKSIIERNISDRGGDPLPIEQRMLASIARHFAAAGVTESQIASTKKLPDLASIIEGLGIDRLAYVVGQRMGSHHVHGTWPSLLLHYLQETNGANGADFAPRDHDCSTHVNQFMFVPLVVIDAMSAYLKYAFADQTDRHGFEAMLDSAKDEIMTIYTQACGGDLAS